VLIASVAETKKTNHVPAGLSCCTAFLIMQICTQLLGMLYLHILYKILQRKYIIYKSTYYINKITRKDGN